MRQLISAVLLVVLGALPLAAQGTKAGGVEMTIQKQIEAFQAHDLATAFSFASPALRQYFQTPQNFAWMVQQGYPMVWRPSGYEFLTLREEGGRYFQSVLFTDRDGAKHVLEYQLTDAAEGWEINSVEILPRPEVGT